MVLYMGCGLSRLVCLRYQAFPERCRHVAHECEVRLRPALNGDAYGVEDTDTRLCVFDDDVNKAGLDSGFGEYTGGPEVVYLVAEFQNAPCAWRPF